MTSVVYSPSNYTPMIMILKSSIVMGLNFRVLFDGMCTHFQDWAGLDPMMSTSRFAKLQSLQKMTEMQEFLEFIAKEGL